MENEGIIVTNETARIKSAIVDQLARLKETTPDQLESEVFQALTGHSRDDVDWNVEDNQAGAFLWLKTFDALLAELEEDGYVRTEGQNGKSVLVATEREETAHFSNVGWGNS